MIELWGVGLAVVLSEMALRLARRQEVRGWAGAVSAHLSAFMKAQDDDERQRCLLRSGWASLRLGLAALGVTAGLVALAGLPGLVMDWDAAQQQRYVLVLSVAATAWALLRAWSLQRRRNGGYAQ